MCVGGPNCQRPMRRRSNLSSLDASRAGDRVRGSENFTSGLLSWAKESSRHGGKGVGIELVRSAVAAAYRPHRRRVARHLRA
jgi:hypothetical protein